MPNKSLLFSPGEDNINTPHVKTGLKYINLEIQ